MLKEKKLRIDNDVQGDVCQRSRNSPLKVDIDFEDFEAELLEALEEDKKEKK